MAAKNGAQKVRLTFRNSTTNKHRYELAADVKDRDTAVTDQLYIPKSAFPEAPKAIDVTIEAVK